jgi:hypothetical protein
MEPNTVVPARGQRTPHPACVVTQVKDQGLRDPGVVRRDQALNPAECQEFCMRL